MTTKTKADENGPFKEFDFEDWLRDGVEGFKSKLEAEIQSFNFDSFRRHVRNARREQLLAMRSLIDNALERLEREEAKTEEAEKA